MKISIIIVAWQASARIRRCLTAVRAGLEHVNAEVIVIDNGSTDGTADLVASHYPDFKLVRNNTNLGFAAANNAGWRQTESEYVLLLNDDAIIGPDTIHTLSSWLDRHPEAGGVTCRFDNSDGSIQRGYHRGLPTLGRMVASFLHHYLKITTAAASMFLLLDEDFAHERVIEQAAATCLLLRRRAVEKAGGLFDEQFAIFFNDADLANRLNRHDTPVWLAPVTAITHLRAQNTERLDPYWAKQEYYRCLFRYFKKSSQFGDYLIGKALFVGLLLVIYGLTWLGLLRSYFGTPITKRAESQRRQLAVIQTILKT